MGDDFDMMDVPAAANWIGEDFEPDYELDASRASPAPDTAAGTSGLNIVASPFVWRNPLDIPPRQWLYGRHLIRGRVSLDVAAGGVGKTSLKVGEAVAMAAGRDLYNKSVTAPLRVWLYNLEDDLDELHRRIAATCIYHRIKPEDLGDRLFVDSGLDRPVTIASGGRDGVVIHAPAVETILAEIARNRIDVMIVDPFVSSHSVSENDNMAIDAVVKKGWVRVAYEGNASVNLVHHIRKGNGEEADIDSARGAVALVSAARSAVVYNRMSKEEAEKAQVNPEQRSFHFKVTNGKANLAPSSDKSDWYRMQNVDLDNGDKVGVADQFLWPAPADTVSPDRKYQILRDIKNSEWVAAPQSKDWVGRSIADGMDLDLTDADDTLLVKSIIKAWLKDGTLARVERTDQYRKTRTFVEVAGG